MMFERFIIDCISIVIYSLEHTCLPFYHPPSILTLTLIRFAHSLASPVHSYGVSADLTFTHFLYLSYSPYWLSYRFCYRWREIGDISTDGSYYKGTGARSERKRATLIIRRLFLPSVISYGFSLLQIGTLCFERFINRFDSSCSRDLI